MYDRCIRSIVKKTSWEFPALRSLEFLTKILKASPFIKDPCVPCRVSPRIQCFSFRHQNRCTWVSLWWKLPIPHTLKLCLITTWLSPDLLFGFKFYIQAVQPSTGDVIYDDFQDGPSYMELEAHLEHICPEELLLPESLTIQTENFIKDFVTRVQRFVINSLHLEGNLKTKKNTPH